MDLNYKNSETAATEQCKWCDTQLTWMDHFASSVCSHCHDLMANAGLQYSEIFGAVRRVGSSLASELSQ